MDLSTIVSILNYLVEINVVSYFKVTDNQIVIHCIKK